jgi:hypothetical protein
MYRFRAACSNVAGQSDKSQSASFYAGVAPLPPTKLQEEEKYRIQFKYFDSTGRCSLGISWQKPEDNGALNVDYTLSHSNDCNGKKPTFEGLTVMEWEHLDEIQRCNYTYEVRAVNYIGSSDPAILTVQAGCKPDPPPIVATQLTEANDIVDITWEHSPNDHGL